MDFGVFTLPDTDADTDTDKKWVVENCVEVLILANTGTVTDANTDTDAIGFHCVGVGASVGKGKICVGVGQWEHTI